MKLQFPEFITAIEPYVTGKPLEELEREHGVSDSIKLASNENPLGPSPKAIEAIGKALEKLHRYPDGACFNLQHKLAEHLNVQPEQIILGNGSDDILGMLARSLLQPGDQVIVPVPSFLMYTIAAQSCGAKPVHVPLKDRVIDLDAVLAQVNSRTRIIFICNPNNPTGTIVTRPMFERFMAALPDPVVVVVDEAYIDFVRDADCADGLAWLNADKTVVTLRTFSKAYGLAGLRVGYGVMPAELAMMLHRVRMPFNVNSLAQTAAVAALDDERFLSQTLSVIHAGLDFLYRELEKRGVPFFASQTNFFLIDVGANADRVFDRFLRKGVIVRSMSAYGFEHYIRINVGLPIENQRFLSALDEVLGAGL
jgi:histidinol-phosphate aminotransferase